MGPNTMAVVDLRSVYYRESALSHKSVVFILEEFDLFAQVIAYFFSQLYDQKYSGSGESDPRDGYESVDNLICVFLTPVLVLRGRNKDFSTISWMLCSRPRHRLLL